MRKFYRRRDGLTESREWEPECWINIESIDDEDLAFLQNELGVPSSFLESVCDQDERPRFDRDGDWLLTILRIPQKLPQERENYQTLTLGVITRNDVIITICRDKTQIIEDFINVIRRRQIRLETKPDFILHVIYISTYWYLNYLREINNNVQQAVNTLRRSVSNDDLYNMMSLQKSLVYFDTSVRGNSTLVGRLDKMFTDDCDPELLEDVDIELQQAQNTIKVYIEILDSTMGTMSSVISNNVNEIMKKMTSVSIILMIPTLIASFYGMNVAVAFGSSPDAFWVIVAFSFALALIIYIVLKHVRWL